MIISPEVSYKVKVDFVPVGRGGYWSEEYVSDSPSMALGKVNELRNKGISPLVSKVVYRPEGRSEEKLIFVAELKQIANKEQSFSE